MTSSSGKYVSGRQETVQIINFHVTGYRYNCALEVETPAPHIISIIQREFNEIYCQWYFT